MNIEQLEKKLTEDILYIMDGYYSGMETKIVEFVIKSITEVHDSAYQRGREDALKSITQI